MLEFYKRIRRSLFWGLLILTAAAFAGTCINGALTDSSSRWGRLTVVLLVLLLTRISFDALFMGKDLRERKPAAASGRMFYLSVLNVIAALFVIYMHTNNHLIFSVPRPHGRTWISANFIESFCYWPVPIFFMISGATLMEYRQRYSTEVFLKKRFVKTFIPFLVWSLIACVFDVLVLGWDMDWNPLHIIQNIFTAKYLTVYWYFPVQFAIYLSMPLLAAVQNKRRVFGYAIMAGVGTISILPLLFHLLHLSWNGALSMPAAGGYLFYTMAGYYLSRVKLGRWSRIRIYICGFCGWMMLFAGTIWASFGSDKLVDTFKHYVNFPAFLQAAAVFVFARYFLRKHEMPARVRKWINELAGLTFGTYLLHDFVLLCVREFTPINRSMIGWRLLAPIGIFFLCAWAVCNIKKVRALAWIVP